MRRTRSLAATSAILWALLTPAAHADLTAAQVWQDWRDYIQGMGYVLTADEATEDGQLAISNLNVGMTMGDDDRSMTMSIGTLTFIEQDDGTVELVLPAVLPMSLTMTPQGDQPPSRFDVNLTQTGQNAIVRGTPEDLVYEYTAQTMVFALDRMVVDDQSFGPDQARFDLALSDVTSTTAVTLDEMRQHDQQVQAGAAEIDLYMAPPDEDSTIAITGRAEALKYTGVTTMPLRMDAADMAAMLEAGFGFEASLGLGAGTSRTEIVAPEGPSTFTSSSASGTLTARMNADGIMYDGAQKDMSLEADIAGFPFPVTLSMAESGFGLTAPVTRSEEPQDFAMRLNLTDFTMSDMIWGIFDPQGLLPRDPATLIVDLTGKARLLFDFMDPALAEDVAGTDILPAEIEALTINTLRLDAVGAELTGEGDVTFDNTDMETYAGVPKPVGEIDLSLTGATALLDTLVEMGLVQQEQAMGARMMMGLFAVPAEGEDALKSSIEFTQDGQILANGQRIR